MKNVERKKDEAERQRQEKTQRLTIDTEVYKRWMGITPRQPAGVLINGTGTLQMKQL